jgi:hypothetical protein
MEKIITKSKLKFWLLYGTPTKTPAQVVGWAVNAIYEKQESDEQASKETLYKNGVGFSHSDAKLGTYTAKQYLQYGTVSEKIFQRWTALKGSGEMKLLKYAMQLNKIANAKKLAKRFELHQHPTLTHHRP